MFCFDLLGFQWSGLGLARSGAGLVQVWNRFGTGSGSKPPALLKKRTDGSEGDITLQENLSGKSNENPKEIPGKS